MLFVSAHDYTAETAWDALDLVTFDQPATVRLHWTNEPYVWHVNDGEEVFVVLDAEVDMHYRDHGIEKPRSCAPVTSAGSTRRRARCLPAWRGTDPRGGATGKHLIPYAPSVEP